jgi:hypothetical protein
MPFIFHTADQLSVITDKNRQGLYFQSFTSSGPSRSLLLHPGPVTHYTATLDHEGTPHIVFKNNKHQVFHIIYKDGIATRTLLFEDQQNTYHFDHFSLHHLNGILHLFYTATTPGTTTTSLLHQALGHYANGITTIIADLRPENFLGIYPLTHSLAVFYTTFSTYHTLHCLSFTPDGMQDTILLNSEYPLSDLSVCYEQGILHLLYTCEVYGKHQLVYFNNQQQTSFLIGMTSGPSQPALFYYLGQLWVTYLENNQLYTMLSVDDGNHFSQPLATSYQQHMQSYNYLSQTPSSLHATKLYAAVSTTLRLAVIASLDTEGIHKDLPPQRELALLLEGLTLLKPQTYQTMTIHPSPLPILNRTPAETNEATSMSKLKSGNVKSASKAFLNESLGFEESPLS